MITLLARSAAVHCTAMVSRGPYYEYSRRLSCKREKRKGTKRNFSYTMRLLRYCTFYLPFDSSPLAPPLAPVHCNFSRSRCYRHCSSRGSLIRFLICLYGAALARSRLNACKSAERDVWPIRCAYINITVSLRCAVHRHGGAARLVCMWVDLFLMQRIIKISLVKCNRDDTLATIPCSINCSFSIYAH